VYTAPLQGDSGVDLGAGIVAAFNAPMDTASINTSTFSVVDGNGQPVDGSVSYVGSTAMFTPSAPLLPQAVYIATVSGSVVAAGGLAMGQDYSWAFKTGSFSTGNAPTVVFANPSPYQSNIWSNITISVAFSAVMDPMTLNTANFQVTDQDGNPVSGSISYIGNMAMFTPDAGLTAGTQYTVTLTSGIKDSSGVSLAAYSWSFTTMMLQ
jgi:large repetitive protein